MTSVQRPGRQRCGDRVRGCGRSSRPAIGVGHPSPGSDAVPRRDPDLGRSPQGKPEPQPRPIARSRHLKPRPGGPKAAELPQVSAAPAGTRGRRDGRGPRPPTNRDETPRTTRSSHPAGSLRCGRASPAAALHQRAPDSPCGLAAGDRVDDLDRLRHLVGGAAPWRRRDLAVGRRSVRVGGLDDGVHAAPHSGSWSPTTTTSAIPGWSMSAVSTSAG